MYQITIPKVIIKFADLIMTEKNKEKWCETQTLLPKFSDAYPGFPDSPPFIPYRMQFYSRIFAEETGVFLHDKYILVFLLEGDLRLEINKAPAFLQAGKLFLIFPGESHRFIPLGERQSVTVLASFDLYDDGRKLASMRGTILEMGAALQAKLLRVIRDYLGCYPQGNLEIATPAYLFADFLEHLRIKNSAAVPETFRFANYSNEGSEIFHKVSQYVVKNLHRKITIEQLSRSIGISASHLRRCFREQVGKSLGAYLRSRRMTFASGLLRSSNMNISQIATHCGYGSAASFSRAFKREAQDQSPLLYRKEIRRQSDDFSGTIPGHRNN